MSAEGSWLMPECRQDLNPIQGVMLPLRVSVLMR
eukprot:SAG11_NODE_19299_length_469_cov_9.375676_1_plen_33_part_01